MGQATAQAQRNGAVRFLANRDNIMHAWDRMMNVAQSYAYKVEDDLLDPDLLVCEECARYIAATRDETLPRYLGDPTPADYTYKCLLAAIYRVGAVVARRDPRAGRDVSMALIAYMPDVYKPKPNQ